VTSAVRTGDAYAYTATGSGSTACTSNGLNQQVSIGGATVVWDNRRNLVTEPQSGKTCCTHARTCWPARQGGATLPCDPAMRVCWMAGPLGIGHNQLHLLWANAIRDYDASNVILHRCALGPGGHPIARYDGTGTTNRRILSPSTQVH
jgi:hypothetical protein